MASIELKEEYLKMVGPLVGQALEGVGDDKWTAIVAFFLADGFITGLDWSTPAGMAFGEMLDSFFDSGKDQ
jgi:hypothetical protein